LINFSKNKKELVLLQKIKEAMQNFKQHKTGKKGTVKFSKVWNI